MMGSFPLGSDLCGGRRWDFQLWKRCHLRGSNRCTGQVSEPADDGYVHPAVRRVGDIIAEAVQQARQHLPQWSSIGSADRLVERNRRAVSNRKCRFQRGENLGQRGIAGLELNDGSVSTNAQLGPRTGGARPDRDGKRQNRQSEPAAADRAPRVVSEWSGRGFRPHDGRDPATVKPVPASPPVARSGLPGS